MIRDQIIIKEIEEIKKIDFLTLGKYPNNYLTYNGIPLILYTLEQLFLDKNYPIEEKKEIIDTIFDSWRNRLKSYQSYSSTGYIFYFYYTFGFYISVAPSNHNVNLNIPGIMMFQTNISDVIQIGLECSEANISKPKYHFNHNEFLNEVEKNKGSISFPTSNKLGITRSELRNYIANNYLGPFVNSIRNKYKRRSLSLEYKPINTEEFKVYIYKKTLPANY